MYVFLLVLHSLVRWLVLVMLQYAVYRGIRGWRSGSLFTVIDERIRHITATVAHVQLMIGYVLYFTSPLVKYFRGHYAEALRQPDSRFFGMIHVLLMTLAVIVVTIGSAMAKRKKTATAKFRTMTCWYIAALVIIFLVIPWPFSPLAKRPFIRNF